MKRQLLQCKPSGSKKPKRSQADNTKRPMDLSEEEIEDDVLEVEIASDAENESDSNANGKDAHTENDQDQDEGHQGQTSGNSGTENFF